jgi:hypothetical protein
MVGVHAHLGPGIVYLYGEFIVCECALDLRREVANKVSESTRHMVSSIYCSTGLDIMHLWPSGRHSSDG